MSMRAFAACEVGNCHIGIPLKNGVHGTPSFLVRIRPERRVLLRNVLAFNLDFLRHDM